MHRNTFPSGDEPDNFITRDGVAAAGKSGEEIARAQHANAGGIGRSRWRLDGLNDLFLLIENRRELVRNLLRTDLAVTHPQQ